MPIIGPRSEECGPQWNDPAVSQIEQLQKATTSHGDGHAPLELLPPGESEQPLRDAAERRA
jgi:hypothetical protein